MNDQIHQELVLLMNIDSNVNSTSQIKILKICSDVLNCGEYVNKVTNSLNSMFNQPTFDANVDFSKLILSILTLNQDLEYYKDVNTFRMKYVIYGVFYAYLLKHQVDWINKTNIGDIRTMYNNCWDSLIVIPETIKIDKVSCLSCLGKSIGLLSWLRGSKISI